VSEARELTEERIQKLADLPLEEVLRFEEHPVQEQITGPSGRSYRVDTYAFWDMEPYDSYLYVRVDLRGRGLHRWQRYDGLHLRLADEDPDEDSIGGPTVSSAWTQNFTCLTLVLIVLGLPLSALYAIRRLFFD
jgi:hypothetical protein